MTAFSLDEIRAAADVKYSSTDITFGDDTLVLRNALRLSKAERKDLSEIQDAIKEDPEEGMAKALTLVAADKKIAAKFIKEAAAGDAAILATVFDKYTGQDQAGEA